MTVVAFLVPFVLLGAIVVFIALSGSPSAAREAYLTRGNRIFRVLIVVIYIGAGVAVPALVLGNRGEASGGTGPLRDDHLSASAVKGKQLFRQNCASCHSLAAINARGITGPNLDMIGKITPARIESAIKIGGTGEGRMPAGLLEGPDAKNVAQYVSEVAGK